MTTDENVKNIKALWIRLAAYYSATLSDTQLVDFTDDCKHYSFEALAHGMNGWRMNPRNTRLPLPSQLLASMGGGSSKADAGGIALALIGTADAKGWTWSQRLNRPYKGGSFETEFRQELGDVAWEVVRMAGGWSKFCGAFQECDNDTAFLAQIRDAIEHVLTTKRGQVTALPAAKSSNGQQQNLEDAGAQKRLGDIARGIGKDPA